MKPSVLCCAALLACMMAVVAPPVASSSTTTISGTIPLIASEVVASDITCSSAVISWRTNGPSTSQVFYDTVWHANSEDYASHVESDDLVSIHSLALNELSSGTAYYYAVKSVLMDNGNPLTAAENNFSFTTPTTGTVITITSPLNGKLPGGQVGITYSQTLVASGGTPPYSWRVVSGSLPDGVSLNTSTGAISGTPTKAGTFRFTVQVMDTAGATATAALRLKITAGSDMSTASLPSDDEGAWQALVRAASIPATCLDTALSSVISW